MTLQPCRLEVDILLVQAARSFGDSLFGVAKMSQFQAFLPLARKEMPTSLRCSAMNMA
jgi:hypothetical protein